MPMELLPRVVIAGSAVLAVVAGYLISPLSNEVDRSSSADLVTPGDSGDSHNHHCDGRGEQTSTGWICVVEHAQLRSEWPFDAVPTNEERRAAEAFVTATEERLRALESVDAAHAAGYTFNDRLAWLQTVAGTPLEEPSRAEIGSGVVVHLVNEDLANDGIASDPAKPDAVMYATDGEKYVLVGAMFLAPDGSDGPQIGGPLTTWHEHTQGDVVCWVGSAPVGFARFRPGDERYRPTGGCERGETRPVSPQMLHVWLGRPSLEATFDDEMSTSEAAELVN